MAAKKNVFAQWEWLIGRINLHVVPPIPSGISLASPSPQPSDAKRQHLLASIAMYVEWHPPRESCRSLHPTGERFVFDDSCGRGWFESHDLSCSPRFHGPQGTQLHSPHRSHSKDSRRPIVPVAEPFAALP